MTRKAHFAIQRQDALLALAYSIAETIDMNSRQQLLDEIAQVESHEDANRVMLHIQNMIALVA